MKTKKKSVFNSPILGVFLSLITNVFAVGVILLVHRYSQVNSKFYLIGVLVVILVVLLLNVFFLLGYIQKKKSFRVIFVLLSLIFSIILGLGNWYIYRGNTSIDTIINDLGVENLEYSLITLDEEMTLDDLSNERIAIVKDETSSIEEKVTGSLAKYSRTLRYVDYNTYRDLLSSSQDGEYSLMVVPKDFRKLLQNESDAKIFENAKTLMSFDEDKEEDISDVNVLKEPFTVLMLGDNEGLSDSIILTSFNPETLQVTMTSLARDSYVPISCYTYNSKDKLNHSRAHSRQCIIDTIEDFLDVEIDFYFESDFYALIKMVDALDGLELESPVSFSGSLPLEDEEWKTEQVTVKKGTYVMSGKEAITFARERQHMPNGDFDRQLNQQYVIQELAKKIFSTRNIETLMNVLDVAKDNIVMNIPIRDLSSLMGYSLDEINKSPVDGLDTFRIVQSQVAGTTPTINGMSVIKPYVKDIEKAHSIITNNMEPIENKNNITNFSFSYTKPYELFLANPDLAGLPEETLRQSDLFSIPDFSGWSLSEIKTWGYDRDVEVVVDLVEDDLAQGLVSQTPNVGDYERKPQEIYITFEVENEQEVEAEIEQRTVNVRNLIGESRSEILVWMSELALENKDGYVTYQINEVEDETADYDEIIGQSVVGNQEVTNSLSVIFDVNKYDASNEQEENTDGV